MSDSWGHHNCFFSFEKIFVKERVSGDFPGPVVKNLPLVAK